MRKFNCTQKVSYLRYALVFSFLFTSFFIKAQVTVTNPTNTTPNLQPTYTTLASAIADLNATTAMSGPVTLTLNAGHSETAPVKGLVLGSATLNAVLSATNTITINKASGTATINAAVGTSNGATAAPDGILVLNGADYVTIDGLTFTDGNSTNATVSMEFGIGLFKRTAGDGSNYNTIQNCIFNMQAVNNAAASGPIVEGSVAIAVYNSVYTAATTALTPTNGGTLATNGTNSFNKIYGNTINGGNHGIALSGFAATAGVGPTPTATTFLGDLSNDVGGSSSATGNTIVNFGGGGTANAAAGIRANNQWSVNIRFNTVDNNNGTGVNHTTTLRGIFAQAGTSATATISNNNITIRSGSTTSALTAIDNGIGSTALSSNTININNNRIRFSYTTATTGIFTAISNSSTAGVVNISANNIQQLSSTNYPTTGTIPVIVGGSPGGTLNITNDTISNFVMTGASGTLRAITASTPTGLYTVTGNLIENLSYTNTSSTGSITGIYNLASATLQNINNNIIRNFSTPATGTLNGIQNNTTTGTFQCQNNQIYNFTTTSGGAGGFTANGIIWSNANVTISGNLIYAINSTGTTGGSGGTINGISLSNGGVVSNNKIYNLSSTSSAPAINGILLSGGTAVTATNNLIANLEASNGASATAEIIRGISITATTATANYNIYYNTVYLNAVSNASGTFSTAGIFHAASSTSTTAKLDLKNNIIVNTSTANGTGTAVAFRRSSRFFANYDPTSNNNLFYVNEIPGTQYLIFADSVVSPNNPKNTMADYRDMYNTLSIAIRDGVSVSENPEFQSTDGSSADFLKYKTTSAKGIESGGVNISGITTDYANNIRQGNTGYTGTGTAPDIGAWELLGIPSYTCTTPSPGNTVSTANNLCIGNSITLSLQNPTVGTGVSYQWQSSTNGTTYANILGATSSTFVTTPTASLYYQCIVTCQSGPSTATSTPVQITFANNIVTTTPANRCGTGTVNLSATGNSGTTIKWYATASGGDTLRTGANFTTPVISTTTNYYVSAGVDNFSSGPATIGTDNAATKINTTGSPYRSGLTIGNEVKNQYLITASELSSFGMTAGNISALTFIVNSVGSGTMQNLTFKIGHTSLTAMTTTYANTSAFTTVLVEPTYTATTGNNLHTFTTPFNWDGTSNIILEVCGTLTAVGGTTTMATFTTPVNTTVGSAANGACANTTGTTTTLTRPVIIFTGQVGTSCYSPRVLVTATVTPPATLTISNDTTLCQNQVYAISVTSNIADFNTYTWSPQANLYTDMAATIPYVAGASATTVYVKSTTPGLVNFVCTASNTTTLCANTDTAKVTILPVPTVAATTNKQQCLSGVVTFGLTPTTGYGAATIQWQSSANNALFNDIASANAVTYTTPTTSTTTYYRAQVKVGANVCTTTNTDTLIVNNPLVLTTTPATRCGTGNITLGATSSAGTTLRWYANATGGLPLATGGSYSTSVSSTTPFYVGAESAASGTTVLGTGASSSTSLGSSLLPGGWGGAKTQYIIRATELIEAGLGAGNITSIGFEPTTSGQTYQGFFVSLGHTTQNVAPTTSFINSGLVPVYAGTLTNNGFLPVANVVNTLQFGTGAGTSSSFNWDGSSNIVVTISWSLVPAAATSTSSSMKFDNISFVSAAYRQRDNITPDSMRNEVSVSSTSSTRPRFTINGQVICSSPRSMVTATVTASPSITATATPTQICVGASTTLSADISSNPNYSLSWSNGAGVGNNVIVSPTTTTTYTVTAIDTSTGTFAGCGATAQYTVNVNQLPPVFTTITATPSAICVGKSSTIAASISASADVNVGTATTTIGGSNGNPYRSGNGSGNQIKTQLLYSAAELTAAGLTAGPIHHLGFTTTTTTGTIDNFEIRLGLTTVSSLSATYETSPLTLVFTQASFTPVAGLNLHTFNQGTFTWDGTSNIIVQTCQVNTAAQGTSTVSAYTPSFASNTHTSTSTTSCSSTTGTAVASKPIIRFSRNLNHTWTWNPGLLSGSSQVVSPTATTVYTATALGENGCRRSQDVTVTVNPLPTIAAITGTTSLCATQTTTLANTTSGGTWISRNNNIATINSSGLVTGVNAGTATIRYVVMNGSGCTDSVSSSVTVNANPSQVVVSPNSATQCTNSTPQKITATGGAGTGTFVWTPTTGLFTDAAATTAYTGTAVDSVFARPGSTTRYTATSTNASNCSSNDTSNIIINCTLPVNYLSFTGVKEAGNNILKWTTRNELNNSGFEVERSIDASKFISLGFVSSKGDAGNSSSLLTYSFTDSKFIANTNYYRLKQIDRNGVISYSNVVAIKSAKSNKLEIEFIYPNPATNILNLVVASPNDKEIVIRVVDIAGKVLIQNNRKVVNGDNQLQLNLNTLTPGTYSILATCKDGCETKAHVFVKQ
jgi:hypothetical protein